MMTSYLLKYAMDSNSWTNITAPDEVCRAEGVMVYVPADRGYMIIDVAAFGMLGMVRGRDIRWRKL